jgi:hypothetical protein
MPLIGNKNTLAFEVIPVTPSWEIRYGPERAAWAGLALWAGGRNLCKHLTPGSNDVEEYLYVPLGPITDWIVRSFAAIQFEERASVFPTSRALHEDAERWGISPPLGDMTEVEWYESREEWWSRHFLRAGSDGAWLPNVAFVRDDEELVIAWKPPRFVGEDAPILLDDEGQYSLPWGSGRDVLEEFVAKVALWLRDGDAGDVFSWAASKEPLAAAPATASNAVSLYTGRPLRQLRELFGAGDDAELLSLLGTRPGIWDPAANPRLQVLRDLSPTLPDGFAAALNQLGNRIDRNDDQGLDRWMNARQLALDAGRPAQTNIEAGYMAAGEVRRWLGLDSQPIRDIDSILGTVGMTCDQSAVVGAHERMIVGMREGGSAAATILQTPRTETRWGTRFEKARAIGHLLLDPIRGQAIGAASGPYAQDTRTRRSGAFAAELLLPDAAINNATSGRLDVAAQPHIFENLMEQYGVGASTTAYHLWNRGWLSSPGLRDELIDVFASADQGHDKSDQ